MSTPRLLRHFVYLYADVRLRVDICGSKEANIGKSVYISSMREVDNTALEHNDVMVTLFVKKSTHFHFVSFFNDDYIYTDLLISS